MTHILNSVNNVKPSSSGDITLGISSIITSPVSSDVLGIDASGNAKKLSTGTQVGDLVLSVIVQSGGWGGGTDYTEGRQTRIRGNSSQIEEDTSLVTQQTQGSANFITGWTLVAGNYLFILNQAIDTGAGGTCNTQLYDVTNSSYVGPKVRYETGRFSSTLTYYSSISSNTLYEYRARDVVGTCRFLNSVTMFSCTIQIFKV